MIEIAKICSQSYPVSLIQAYLRPYMVISCIWSLPLPQWDQQMIILEASGSSTPVLLE